MLLTLSSTCYPYGLVLSWGYKLGYHILVLPNQVLLINSDHTNEVLLHVPTYAHGHVCISVICTNNTHAVIAEEVRLIL